MNKQGAAGDAAGIDLPDIDKVLAGDGAKATAGGSKPSKRLSVERIYQKKTQLEHILLRPDTYIGSVEKVSQVGGRLSLLILHNDMMIKPRIMLLAWPTF